MNVIIHQPTIIFLISVNVSYSTNWPQQHCKHFGSFQKHLRNMWFFTVLRSIWISIKSFILSIYQVFRRMFYLGF